MRSDCVWREMACCLGQGCEGCKAYRGSGTEKGRDMSMRHRKETVEAIKPVQDKWMGWLERIKKRGYKDDKRDD